MANHEWILINIIAHIGLHWRNHLNPQSDEYSLWATDWLRALQHRSEQDLTKSRNKLVETYDGRFHPHIADFNRCLPPRDHSATGKPSV